MNINIDNLKEFLLQNISFANEKTVDMVVNELKQILIKYNFDIDNLNIKYGETSLNFIKDEIVIRLTYVRYNNFGYDTISDYVSNSSSIEQPIYEQKIDTGEVNYPTILVLRNLEVGSVTPEERDEVYIKLREDGYIFNDVEKLENFGKDEKGNVYLIDFGELMYTKDNKKINSDDLYVRTQYKQFVDRELKYHKEKCKKLNKKYESHVQRKKIINKLKEMKSTLINQKKSYKEEQEERNIKK